MAYVKVKDGSEESLNKAINKFNSKVFKEGILKQYMDNRFYTKPSDKKRLQKRRENFNYKIKNKYL